MAKFKNDKGLTLIELLITIAVLAVVSAIALPIVNNVVASSNSNATAQTQGDAKDFVTKYNAAGEVLFASTTAGAVLSGYVDTDGDNTIDSNELVDTLTIDGKFLAIPSGTSDNVGGSYTSKGISALNILTYDEIAGSNKGCTQAGGCQWPIPVSATWSPSTPVLVVYSSQMNNASGSVSGLYVFIPAANAEYVIDYYDSASSGLTITDNTYLISTQGNLEYQSEYLTQYDANPFTGPANKVAINWVGAAGGGGK